MRIIFLNIWHGQAWDKLKEFILSEAKTTDVFCFVEVNPKLQLKLAKLLGGFNTFYEELIETEYLKGGVDGQSIFVRKEISVESHGVKLVYKISKKDAGALQTATINVGRHKVFIGNIHGKALPGHKKDTDARIKQSEKTVDFFKNKKGLKIIGGDFNLLPDTKSVEMFEKSGYRNLIKDFKIKTTRNKLSWDQFGQKADFEKQYFADYVFVSSNVNVKNFEVPNIEISDHLPLILDFVI